MANPNATIIHYPITHSDHSPLVMSLFGSVDTAPKSFKFEGFWTWEASCVGVVASAWSSVGGNSHAHALFRKIRATWFALRQWNKRCFGQIQSAIRRTKEQLASYQLASPSTTNFQLAQKLNVELDEHLQREETLWREKSRETWLVSSDLNTKFYDASTTIRICHNQFLKLKSDSSGWISRRDAIGKEMADFYQHLFTSSHPTILEDLETLIDPLIVDEEDALLIKVPEANEIFYVL